MPLSRAYESYDAPPEARRIFEQARVAFDIPFVPTVFKVAAGLPEYLHGMWSDLREVAESREFAAAADGLSESMRSAVVSGGWSFSDQERVLAAQKFSAADTQVMAGVAGTFLRAMPRLMLFTRLMQRGYCGGQKGRTSPRRTVSAFSRLVTLHIPNERDASLRAWLIYSEIRRTTGARYVPSLFRAISPYPSYLGALWVDMRRLFADPSFVRVRDEIARRSVALLSGLPVKDHRATISGVSQQDWQEIEQTVDGFARLTPQYALGAFVWRRSFATPHARLMAS